MESTSHLLTTTAGPEHFTINFTITNLPYDSNLATPNSARLNTTRRVMTTLAEQTQLPQLLLVGLVLQAPHQLCRPSLDKEVAAGAPGPQLAVTGHRRGALRHGFVFSRPVGRGDNTGVDAVCTYTKEPSAPGLDRVGLYHEVSNKTGGISRLGPYNLDRDSLYVNGDQGLSLCLPAAAFPSPRPSPFPTPAHPSLPLFPGYNEPPVTPSEYLACLHSLAPAPSHCASMLLAAPTHPPTTTAGPERFTINFTITNLPYDSNLATPNSARLNTTRRVMTTLVGSPRQCHGQQPKTPLTQLKPIPPRPVTRHVGEQTKPHLATASFEVPVESDKVAPEPPFLQAEQTQLPQPLLVGLVLQAPHQLCRPSLDKEVAAGAPGPQLAVTGHRRGALRHGFVFSRPVGRGDNTGVDAVCTYTKEPSAPGLDRVGLYHEVSNKTGGISRLGPYNLDRDSLYVNGYNEPPVTPSEYLAATRWTPRCQGGGLAGQRPLRLSTQCLHSLAPAPSHCASMLLAAPTHPPTTTAGPERFTINFTITNLPYDSNLATPNSARLNTTRRVMTTLVGSPRQCHGQAPHQLCRPSLDKEVAAGAPGPQLAVTGHRRGALRHGFVFSRPVGRGDNTGVDAVCTYTKEPSAPGLDRVGLYHEVSNKTGGISRLGPYNLDRDSLYVNGDQGLSLCLPAAAFPSPRPSPFPTPAHPSLPLFPGYNEPPVTPSEYLAATRWTPRATSASRTASPGQGWLWGWARKPCHKRGACQPSPSPLRLSTQCLHSLAPAPSHCASMLLAAPTHPPTTTAGPERFTINFTITNLPYDSNLATPNSARLNTTRRVMTTLQPKTPLTQLKPIPPRPVTRHVGEQTKPHLATASFEVPVESDKVAPEPPFLQAEQTQLPQPLLVGLVLQAPHQLCRPSLDKEVAAGAPGPQLAVTGHRRGALRHGFVFSRPVGRGDNTGVDAVCTYTKEPSAPGLDRVGLYHEVSNKTGGISRLGPYNLDRDSLYVNGDQGLSLCLPAAAFPSPRPSPFPTPAHPSLPLFPGYNEPPVTPSEYLAATRWTPRATSASRTASPGQGWLWGWARKPCHKRGACQPSPSPLRLSTQCLHSLAPAPSHCASMLLAAPTHPPTTTAGPERFTINFTITNLPYDSNLATPNSARLNTTRRVMTTLVGSPRQCHGQQPKTPLTQLKPIPPRPVTRHVGEQTKPHLATASFEVPVESDKVAPEPPFLQAEQTQLPQPLLVGLVLQAPHQLCRPSLDKEVAAGAPGPQLAVTGHRRGALRHGFVFSRPVGRGDNTGVDAVCTYTKEPSAPGLDRVGLYHEVSNKTGGISRLGPYNLDRDSLYVNGDQGLSLCLPAAAFPSPRPSPFPTPAHPSLPLFPGYNEPPVTPSEYLAATRWTPRATSASRTASPGQGWLWGWARKPCHKRGACQPSPSPLRLSTQCLHSLAPAPSHCASMLLAAPTHPPTTTAGPERFTINFTITNLPYDSNLATPNSARLNTTRRVMTTLVGSPRQCHGQQPKTPLTQLKPIPPRPVTRHVGEQTKPHLATASFEVPVESDKVAPEPPFLQAEQTQLPQPLLVGLVLQAPHQLCRPSLDKEVAAGAPGPQLAVTGHRRGALRHGFVFSRPVGRGDNTGVDAVCTYTKEPSAPGLDRVGLYHEVSNKTGGISRLGPYNLDRDSLYVNGDQGLSLCLPAAAFPSPRPSPFPTPAHPSLPLFPGYNEPPVTPSEYLAATRWTPRATSASRTASPGQGWLWGWARKPCHKRGACQPSPSPLRLSTQCLHSLAPAPSHCASMLLAAPTHPPTTTAGPERFTINFTITNLPYDSNLATPNSARLNTTRRVMTTLVGSPRQCHGQQPKTPLTQLKPIPPRPVTRHVGEQTKPHLATASFEVPVESDKVAPEPPFLQAEQTQLPQPLLVGLVLQAPHQLCRPSLDKEVAAGAPGPQLAVTGHRRGALRHGFVFSRPVGRGDNTGVDAVCTYTKEPSAPGLDRVGLYHEVSNKTGGISRLGPYNLDRDSLYVNGDQGLSLCLPAAAFPSPRPSPFPTPAHPSLPLFPGYNEPPVTPSEYLAATRWTPRATSASRTASPGQGWLWGWARKPCHKRGACQPSPSPLRLSTQCLHSLAPAPSHCASMLLAAPTHPPTTTAGPERFTINFTITNLPYDSNLATPNSARLNTTRRVMTTLVGSPRQCHGQQPKTPLTQLKPIPPRPVTRHVGEQTKPHLATASFEVPVESDKVAPEPPFLQAEQTQLPQPLLVGLVLQAPHQLCRPSLDKEVAAGAPGPQLAVTGHRRGALRHGFVFSRPVGRGDNTGVDAVCTYTKEPSAPGLDRVGLYHEVSNKTGGISRLGPYNLDRDSLYVNGDQGLSLCLPAAAFPSPRPSPFPTPAHPSLPLFPGYNEPPVTPSEYLAATRWTPRATSASRTASPGQGWLWGWARKPCHKRGACQPSPSPLRLSTQCLHSLAPAPSHCASMLLAAPTHPPTTTAGPERFTINFTITNLPYDSNLATPNSARLNTTRRVMTTLVGSPRQCHGQQPKTPLTQLKPIPPRPVTRHVGEQTKPHLATASFEVPVESDKVAPEPPFLQAEQTQLPQPLLVGLVLQAPHQLCRPSLDKEVAAGAPGPQLAVTGHRRGALRHGFVFSRPVGRGDNTGVDAVCTYTKEPSAPGLDRVGLYHEVSNKTGGISRLGPYNLDRDSLYVNGDQGYNEPPVTPSEYLAATRWTPRCQGGGLAGQRPLRLSTQCLHSLAPAPSHCASMLLAAPTHPPTTTAGPERFTINFTITNLPYDSNLATPNSARLNTTRRVMTTLVGSPRQCHGQQPKTPLTQLKPIPPRPVTRHVGEQTKPHLATASFEVPVESDKVAPEPPFLQAEQTQLPQPLLVGLVLQAPHQLCRPSLDKEVAAGAPGPQLAVTGHRRGALRHGFVFSRPVGRGDNTGVDAVCTYTKEPSAPGLDRVGLYHEVSNKTGGISRLGPYNLDRDSLYVNGDQGYNEPPVTPSEYLAATRWTPRCQGGGLAGQRPLRLSTQCLHSLAPAPSHCASMLLAAPTHPPTTTAGPERFTINFTITNLPYDSNLATPNSARLNTTRRVMTTLVGSPRQCHGQQPKTPLTQLKPIPPRPVTRHVGEQTKPHLATASFEVPVESDKVAPEPPFLQAEQTQLPQPLLVGLVLQAPHQLCRPSLDKEVAAGAPGPQLAVTGHRRGALRHGFVFSRPVGRGDNTGVDAVCTYTKEPSAPGLDRVGLYHEVSNKTGGISRLGPYNLDRDSLYVNGDQGLSLCLPAAAFPSPRPSPFPTPAHPSLPLFPGYNEPPVTPSEYLAATRWTPRATSASRTASPGQGWLWGWARKPCHKRGACQPSPSPLRLSTQCLHSLAPAPSHCASMLLAAPTHPPTTTAGPERFTINFTITNLPYDSNLATPNSARLNTTRRVMTTLVGSPRQCHGQQPKTPLTQLKPIPPRPVTRHVGEQTKPHLATASFEVPVESDKVAPEPPFLQAEQTQLPQPLLVGLVLQAPHQLCRPSLDKEVAAGAPGPQLAVTGHRRGALRHGFVFSRPVGRGDNTGVDAVCTYTKEPSAPGLDRVGLYHEVSNKTGGISRLGPYNLDRDSLYVNGDQGLSLCLPAAAFPSPRPSPFPTPAHPSLPLFPGYNEPPVIPTPTHPPTTTAGPERFTINFTITNLPYDSNLATPNSARLNTTRRVMTTLQPKTPLTQLKPIPPRPVTRHVGEQTKPHLATASFEVPVESDKVAPEPPFLQAEQTQLPQPLLVGLVLQAPHQLCRPSLDKEVAAGAPGPQLAVTGHRRGALRHGFVFSRPVGRGDNTGVDAVCTYTKEPSAPGLDRVGLYHEVSNKTGGISRLGPYNLDRDSLYVNGDQGLSLCLPAAAFPSPRPSPFPTPAHPSLPLFPGYNEPPVTPSEYLAATRWTPRATSASRTASPGQGWLWGWARKPCHKRGACQPSPSPLRLSTQCLHSLAPAPSHCASMLLAAPTHPPTTTAGPERFTINFTITNLPYDSNLATPNSARLNTTRRVMTTLVGSPRQCHGQQLKPIPPRPVTRHVGEQTKPHLATASFEVPVESDKVAPEPPFLQAEQTQLPQPLLVGLVLQAPHQLCRPSLDKEVAAGAPGPQLAVTGHRRGALRHGFVFSRPVGRGDNTGVDAVCTYTKEPSAPGLDRVGLYHEVSNKTGGISRLGPYNLDRDSLYVNGDQGYNEPPVTPSEYLAATRWTPRCQGGGLAGQRPLRLSTQCLHSLAPAPSHCASMLLAAPTHPPTTTAGPERFTINFTITNLPYDSNLATPNSARLNTTRRVMTTLLNRLLKDSSIGPAFLACGTTAFRPVGRGDNTGVDAVCTYTKEPSAPGLDRVGLYHEVSNKTGGISRLGPYNLDRDSLYVNGDQGLSLCLPAAAFPSPRPSPFPTPAHPSLPLFPGYNEPPVTPSEYLAATRWTPRATSASRTASPGQGWLWGWARKPCHKRGACQPSPSPLRLSTQCLHSLAPAPSHCASMLLAAPTHPPTTTAGPERFTINFTITNLPYDSNLATPNSARLNTTRRVMTTLVGSPRQCHGQQLKPIPPRPVTRHVGEQTKPHLATASFEVPVESDKVAPEPPFLQAEQTQLPQPLLVGLVLQAPHQLCRPSLDKEVAAGAPGPQLAVTGHRRGALRHGFVFSRPVGRGDNTGVDAVCTYTKEPSAPGLDRVGLYHEVSNKTGGISRLGPYNLDRDSLYVNGDQGYNEPPVTPSEYLAATRWTPRCQGGGLAGQRPLRLSTQCLHSLAPAPSHCASMLLAAPTHPPTTTAGPERFTINFTITNLPYDSNLATPNSARLNTTRRVMTTLLNRLLKDSSIGPAFLACGTTAFRPVGRGDNTGVDAVCTYTKEPSAPGLDRVGLYHEVSNKTGGISRLGPYNLDRDSLYVNGDQGLSLCLPAAAFPSPRPSPFPTPAHPSLPLFPGYNEPPVTPSEYLAATRWTPRATSASRTASPGQGWLWGWARKPCHKRGACQPSPSLAPAPSHCASMLLAAPTHPPTTTAGPERFTINFTITNLPYDSNLATPNSARLNTTRRVMTTLQPKTPLTQLKPIPPRPVTRHVGEQTKPHLATASFEVPVESDKVAPEPPFLQAEQTQLPQPLLVGLVLQAPHQLCRPSLDKEVAAGAPGPQLAVTGHRRGALRHGFVFSRPVGRGDNTGVDAVCTYTKEPSAPGLDRVGLYHEVSNKTGGISRLGPYNLDRDSLYVNGDQGLSLCLPAAAFPSPRPSPFPTPAHPSLPLFPGYNEPPVTPTSSFLIERNFTVNFTITNLLYSSLGDMNSEIFSAANQNLTYLLDRMLKNSSIKAVFRGCTVMVLRSVKNREVSAMDAVCTYKANATPTEFDQIKVYHELSKMTANCTELGPYRLDAASFYVNGYNELQPGLFIDQSTKHLSPPVRNFTLNFTITNLPFTADLGMPNSKKFKSTEKVMYNYVDHLLQKSSIGSIYIGCRIMAFRSKEDRDDTEVDAICSYRDEPSDFTFNKVTVYNELRNMTNGITKLGHYSLNSQSLYINDYNEPHALSLVKPSTTQSPGQIIEQFTLNFTITNLRFTTDLGTPHSAKFNSTKKIMQHYLVPLLQKSSIGSDFIGCKAIGFRSMGTSDNTAVDAICNYGNGSQVPQLDQVKVYQELRSMTNGITKLGIYKLDNKSLYINGYNEPLERSSLSITTVQSPTSSHFTLNFTLTNLQYTADLDAPSSRKFISTEKAINHYIDPLFKRSSISSVYIGCKVMRFRSGRDMDNTGIDAVCSYKNDISIARFDREMVYHELSTMTNGITKLGHYSLEKNSLYIDGFHLSEAATTRKPVLTKAPAIMGYKLSFRIVNENLTNPDSQSPEYKAAVESISNKMNRLYRQSNLQDQFLNCSITRLRSGSIVVDCKCFFQAEPSINRTVVERAFQDGTSNATGLWLGSSYQLQEFSVGGLELAIEAATYKTPLNSGKENFRLKFRISNLPYSPELQDSRSQMYQEVKKKIEKELDVFRTSSMKDYFAGCNVESFGPVHGKAYVSVDSVCKFTLESFSRTLQKQDVYEELKHLTHRFTKLGSSYELEEQSLVVEGYSPLTTVEQESKRSELQFWAIILICIFTLLGFVLLLLLCFLIVSCLRRKSQLYQVQQGMYGGFFPHLNTRKVH
ncbi:mucin-16 [Anas platyrhynchos]